MMERDTLFYCIKPISFREHSDPQRKGTYSGWTEKDLDEANFIWDMRELMEIFETDQYSEFFFEYKNGEHEPGRLLR